MPSSRGNYRQRWRNDEPDDEEIYEDIRRSLEEDENSYYERGGRGGSSYNSNNGRNGGSNTSSSFYHNSDEKLKKLSECYEKIRNFFEILGEDIEMYLKEDPETSTNRRR